MSSSFSLAHVRTGSAGSPMDINNIMQSEEDLRCMKIGSHKAHQQAITVLDSEGGRVLTGSQDHTHYILSMVIVVLYLVYLSIE